MACCLHYATITKHSNLNLIDRLQFPWLTASIGTRHVNKSVDVLGFGVGFEMCKNLLNAYSVIIFHPSESCQNGPLRGNITSEHFWNKNLTKYEHFISAFPASFSLISLLTFSSSNRRQIIGLNKLITRRDETKQNNPANTFCPYFELLRMEFFYEKILFLWSYVIYIR